MPRQILNQGHFETAVLALAPGSAQDKRIFMARGMCHKDFYVPLDNSAGDIGTHRRGYTAFIVMDVFDANNPEKYDEAIINMILDKKPWETAKANCLKLQDITDRLREIPGMDALTVLLANLAATQAGVEIIDHVIFKDFGTARLLDAIDGLRPVDMLWFVEKKNAAVKALQKMNNSVALCKQEVKRLQGANQLPAAPPDFEGLTWLEQLYLIGAACTAAKLSYEFDVTV